jgi:transcriptional regulator with XRE-family HTH domain
VAKRQRLAQRRKSVGYSQEQLAERLGVDRSTIGRWESGDTQPLPWLRPNLAKVLQISRDTLDSLLDDVDDHTDRMRGIPTDVDLTTMAQLRAAVQGVDERYRHEPSATLLAEAGKCLATVTLLRTHARSLRAREELLALEAEAATLLGQLVWDASQRRDHLTARTYYARAISAAQQLDRPVVEALAVLRTCHVALYGERNPRLGLDLACRAGDLSRFTHPVLAGLASLHVAEAHAMMNQASECDHALGMAETYFLQVPADDASADQFATTHFGRLAGSCFLSLGRYQRAEDTLAGTARKTSGTAKSRAITLGNLGLAHLGQGKIEEAAAAIHQAIDVLAVTWGGGGLTIVFNAARQMRPWKHTPAVSEVNDRLMALIGTG